MTSSTSPITAMRPSARALITLLAALSMVFAQLVGFTAQPAHASNTIPADGPITGGADEECAALLDILIAEEILPEGSTVGSSYKWDVDGGDLVFDNGSASPAAGTPNFTDYDYIIGKYGQDTYKWFDTSDSGNSIGDDLGSGLGLSHVTGCTFIVPEVPGDGTIIVAKVVDGAAVPVDLDDFDFDIACTDVEESLSIAAGQQDEISQPGGYSNCTVTEDGNQNATSTIWTVSSDSGTDGSGLETDSFNVSENETVTVTFTNTYDPPTVPPTPEIGIVKTAVSADVDFTFSNGTLTVSLTEGESAEITYEYLITNEGDEDLDTLGLEDDVIGDLTDEFVDAVDDEYGATFPVGGEVTVTATYTTTADDFATGSVTNVATVTGTGVTSGDDVDAEDDETIDITGVLGVVFEPGISVEKTAIGGVSDNVVVFNADGDAVAVTYQFVVTNTGDEDLDSLTVIDDKIGDLTEAFLAALGGTVLPVGASVTFTAIHEVVIDDFKDDSLTNVVEATGVGVESRGAVDDDDSETISFTQVAGVVIVDDSQPVATEATTLPRTGFDTGVLAGLGLLLAALGAAALLLGRRREEGDLS